MTLLTVWPDADPDSVLARTEDAEEIRDELKQLGVRFERWDVVEDLSAEPSSEEVLHAYREQVDRVVDAEGYVLVDALYMTPSDDPAWTEMATNARQKFLAEHTHDDDEDRFFARGAGVFYLHVHGTEGRACDAFSACPAQPGAGVPQGKVYAVLCEAGDLLSVPAKTTHWFDMGTHPDYVAIRFFHDDKGWVGNFTGNRLAETFPDFDTLMAGREISS